MSATSWWHGTDIYTGQQLSLNRMRSEAEIEAEIARFSRLGALLRTILHPDEESMCGSGAGCND